MPTPVRPHLAAVLARTSHVLIAFDAIAGGAVRTAGTGRRLGDLMRRRGERFSLVAEMLAGDDDWYAIAVERGHGRDAFAMYAEAEREATAESAPKPYVPEFLAACRESGRGVVVAGNQDQHVVRAYLERHGLARRVDHVLCRRALLPPGVEEFAPSAGCLPGELAAVSGCAHSLWRAEMAGMLRIGVEGGGGGGGGGRGDGCGEGVADSRKLLAGTGRLGVTNTGATRGPAIARMWPVARGGLVSGHVDRVPVRPERPTPVVGDLGRLAAAMLAVLPEATGRRGRRGQGRWWAGFLGR
ncbi:HAD family hydrolase [Phytomonospora sp. NPDC050363]|uniref:HAD family hydrolase n=1 Tax=Phytomonospora sp. NPDC050363 TaxID=3155642 RepID=UPI00340B94A9